VFILGRQFHLPLMWSGLPGQQRKRRLAELNESSSFRAHGHNHLAGEVDGALVTVPGHRPNRLALPHRPTRGSQVYGRKALGKHRTAGGEQKRGDSK
jgi:hypothetical protein